MTSSASLDDTKTSMSPTPAAPVPPMSPVAPSVASATNGAGAGTPLPDFEKLATNTAQFIQQGGRALSAYFKPFENGQVPKDENAEMMISAAVSIGKIAEHWMSDPARIAAAQSAIAVPFIKLWGQTYRRLNGEQADPVVPLGKDKRFAAPEWTEMPIYEFLRQAHAIAASWLDELVEGSTEVDAHTRAKAKFYLRQITTALSPANYLATNPELVRETLASSGENLARGIALLAEDMEAGKGKLRIRQTDTSKFELGVNVAVTPGKVVYRNDIMELIQYEPATPDVLKRPLLVIPPWINKYYILDLNREKTFLGWAVSQGATVFVISWVNPDERHRDKTFESYMREGIFEALGAIEQATGEPQVNAAGYCIGGTLLATTLAYMAKTDDHRIASATFLTAQADFSDAGDLKVFIDEDQIRGLEAQMAVSGYLDGSKMAMAFNLLRPNDLLWSYVVDNYMKGKTPKPFDLLFWNSDATRLPACNHSFYMRSFYLDNKLAKGEMTIGGQTLDLGKVQLPTYFMAAQEDHIAPADSVFRGAGLFGGDPIYTLAGSGHIAGVINPPAKPKYWHMTGDRPSGTLKDWTARATKHTGSWWPNWFAWLESQAPEKVPPRKPGSGGLHAICDAPGEYVRVMT